MDMTRTPTMPGPSSSSRPMPKMAPHLAMSARIMMAPAMVAAMVEIGCPGCARAQLVASTLIKFKVQG